MEILFWIALPLFAWMIWVLCRPIYKEDPEFIDSQMNKKSCDRCLEKELDDCGSVDYGTCDYDEVN